MTAHRMSRSSASIIEVAPQNPLRVLFVICERKVLPRRRINGESPRESGRGAKKEGQANVYPSAPIR